MRDLAYPIVIPTAKLAFKALGLRFVLRGAEHIPRTGGALLAVNHVSYVDFILCGYAAVPSDRLVRFMAKKETFDHPASGWLMRALHHIRVDRTDGIASMDEAVRYLRMGEVVGIFPEATISRSFEIKEIKTGAVRIAAEAGVPLVPVVLWGTQRLITKDHPRDLARGKTIAITVGEPIYPTGEDPIGDTRRLHATMTRILDETIRAYPAEEQPPGSWWLPASYGGTAPDPEHAHRLDLAERRARAKGRAAMVARRRAKKEGKT